MGRVDVVYACARHGSGGHAHRRMVGEEGGVIAECLPRDVREVVSCQCVYVFGRPSVVPRAGSLSLEVTGGVEDAVGIDAHDCVGGDVGGDGREEAGAFCVLYRGINAHDSDLTTLVYDGGGDGSAVWLPVDAAPDPLNSFVQALLVFAFD